jgi:hypothetical protein
MCPASNCSLNYYTVPVNLPLSYCRTISIYFYLFISKYQRYTDALLGSDRETTRQLLLLGNSPEETMEVLLEAVISMWFASRLYHATNRVQLVQLSWLVSEWVRGPLQFSPCEPLLLEAGSWGTGIIRESRVSGTSAVGSRYQTTTGEKTADWNDIVRAIVNCRVCELAILL